jgi:Sensors of blue-light using FAD
VKLRSLTYSSWASRALVTSDLERILQSCRVNNGLDGVTGILIYSGGAFVQVLEGAPHALDDALERIRRDTRHRDLTVRDDRLIPERSFPNWDMAYLELENGHTLGRDALERALDRPVAEPTLQLLQDISRTMQESA